MLEAMVFSDLYLVQTKCSRVYLCIFGPVAIRASRQSQSARCSQELCAPIRRFLIARPIPQLSVVDVSDTSSVGFLSFPRIGINEEGQMRTLLP